MRPDNAANEARDRRRHNDVNRGRVSEESLQKLAEAIGGVDDTDAATALSELAHVLTGDDRFDTTR